MGGRCDAVPCLNVRGGISCPQGGTDHRLAWSVTPKHGCLTTKTIVCPTSDLTGMWKLQARRLSACASYFAAMIESTWIVFVAASSVPFTVTFLAANFSALFWSLS